MQYVGPALAGTVWETIQKGLHAPALFGRSCLCGIPQGSAGEAGVLKTTGRSDWGAHMGEHKLQGKQAVVF